MCEDSLGHSLAVSEERKGQSGWNLPQNHTRETHRTWIMQGLGQPGEALGFYSKLSRMSTKDFKQENN